MAKILLSMTAMSFLGGCAECEDIACPACEPPIVLSVTDDQTGDPIPGVTVDGDECYELTGPPRCYVRASVGTHSLEVTAPGYETQQVEVRVRESSGDGCCGCGHESVSRDVALESI